MNNYSTETVLLSIVNDILNSVDKWNKMKLVILDMPAAVYTISQTLLIEILEYIYNILNTCICIRFMKCLYYY